MPDVVQYWKKAGGARNEIIGTNMTTDVRNEICQEKAKVSASVAVGRGPMYPPKLSNTIQLHQPVIE